MCRLTVVLLTVLISMDVSFGGIYDLENIHPKTSADGRISVDYFVNEYVKPIAQYSVDSGEFIDLPMPGEKYYGWPSEISGDGTMIEGTVFEDIGSEREYYRAAYWKQIDLIDGIPQYDCHVLELLEGCCGTSAASDMSANGKYFVGRCESSSGEYINVACLWETDGDIFDLGCLEVDGVKSNSNSARAISNNKIIVGHCLWMQPEKELAFIWDESHGMRYLKDALEQKYGYDFGNSTLTNCWYISPDGTELVGDGIDQNGEWFRLLATIPEPTTLALFAIGGLVVLRRRRK